MTLLLIALAALITALAVLIVVSDRAAKRRDAEASAWAQDQINRMDSEP